MTNQKAKFPPFLEVYKQKHPEDAQDLTDAEHNPKVQPPWMQPHVSQDSEILFRLRRALYQEWQGKDTAPKADAADYAAAVVLLPLHTAARNLPRHRFPNLRTIIADDAGDLEVEAAYSLWCMEDDFWQNCASEIARLAHDVRTVQQTDSDNLAFMTLLQRQSPQAARTMTTNITDNGRNEPPPTDDQAILKAFRESTQALSERTTRLAASAIANAMGRQPRQEAALRQNRRRDDSAFDNLTQQLTSALAALNQGAFAAAAQALREFDPKGGNKQP